MFTNFPPTSHLHLPISINFLPTNKWQWDLLYGRETLSPRLGPADLIEQPTSVPRYDRAPRINWPIDLRTQQRASSAPHRIEDDQGRRVDYEEEELLYKTRRMRALPRSGREPDSPLTLNHLMFGETTPPSMLSEPDYQPPAQEEEDENEEFREQEHE
jgi:hypothetical protein